jgi:2-keto-4-pentenoate hydratase/2-oxohepta-3-ene-1,7-dioic acid hydratase in catechol pathway
MKICHFLHNNEQYWGAFSNGRVYPFPTLEIPKVFEFTNSSKSFEIESVKLLAPVAPSKIVCVGRNYAEHAAELGNEIPKFPLLFLKAPSALITENEAIRIPAQSNQVEHEGELGIIIGRECRKLDETVDPFDFVLGYVCLNDVTARDIQRQDVQFTRGKSFDTFCPVGAFIETELDVSDIRVQTRVNGFIKQDGRTSQMVFPADFLLRYISNQMTLYPGDLIATGTPSGVSKLNEGDVCEVEIEGIGILRNPVSK